MYTISCHRCLENVQLTLILKKDPNNRPVESPFPVPMSPQGNTCDIITASFVLHHTAIIMSSYVLVVTGGNRPSNCNSSYQQDPLLISADSPSDCSSETSQQQRPRLRENPSIKVQYIIDPCQSVAHRCKV